MTGAKGEGYLEPVAGPGQEPGAVGVATASDPSVAPLRLGEAERGIADTRRADSAASGTRAATPGVLPRAAPGGVEPGGGGNPLGGPQPGRGEGQPAAGWKGAAAPRQGATEAEEEWEKAGPPLGETPPEKGEARGVGRAAEREGAPWRHTKDLGEEAMRLLGAGGGPPWRAGGASRRKGDWVTAGASVGVDEGGDGRRGGLRGQPLKPPRIGFC